ncbi:MAG: DUF4981 domain-containing protein, partial [Opitutaceae bacterium]|nr:DUF4981 domain-containing protein [Opitutaceae bacterium]
MKAILDSARLPIRIVMFTAFALLSVAPNAQTQLSTPNAQAQPSAPDAITTTQRQYLSGHGPKDAIPWEFTVSDGRRAGEKTTIPVPSQWEQHGFGAYNYGSELNKAGERGLYRTRFRVPAAWRDCRIRLVFGAVMTDATVTVNGQPAGPTHQGGFTQFSYDVTKLLKPGADNELVVDVAKVSADAATERAERKGDYWVFGGIYRPVWLEAVPARFIEHVAIDAGADGRLTADITLNFLPEPRRPDGPTLVPETLEARLLDADGQPAAAPVIAKIPAGGTGRMRVAMQADAPRLWTAETPHLYVLRVTRHRGDKALHTVDTRFGFRTFEVRDGDGLYLNGQRILLKGVNRHSFRPATGRALDREDCYADARMIRSMNMNAVRMSHYPPDTAFLEACDELGLYVIDELSGWQAAHGTPIARLLVRELVERDVNHPSILLWSNGNEGGWNRDLDGDYALYDPQQRRVIHAWDPFGGIDTRHYTRHSEHMRRLNGPHLVMPTEILHGLHDGGAGAGLHDYWHALAASKVGAGMFIWDYADAGIARTDRDGKIDVFSTYGPDGILGPNLEKDGSYYAIKHIWSPVQIAPASPGNPLDGRLQIHNRYDFTPLDRARLKWRWLRWNGDAEKTLAQGETPLPPIAPHAHGELTLPPPPPAAAGKDAHALAVTAINPHGEELWTWTWPTPALAAINAQPDRDTPAPTLEQTGDTTIVSIACDWPAPAPTLEKTGDTIRLSAAGTSATLDAATGELRALRRGSQTSALSHGPRLAFVRPPAPEVPPEWMPWSGEETNGDIIIRRLASPQIASVLEAALDLPKAVLFA